MQNTRSVNSWLLAGLATGAVAWYLFGTKNGKEFLNSLADAAKDVSGEIKENVKNKYNTFSKQAKEMADQPKSTHAY